MEKLCKNCGHSTPGGRYTNNMDNPYVAVHTDKLVTCNFFTFGIVRTREREVLPAGISMYPEDWCTNWKPKEGA